MFQPSPSKTFEEACAVMSAAYGSSSGFTDSPDGVPVVEDEIVEGDAV